MRRVYPPRPVAHFFFLALPCRLDMLDPRLPARLVPARIGVRKVSSPMIKSFLSVAAALVLLGLPARADAPTGPLVVTPQTSDWSVKYQKDASSESYQILPPTAQTADFAFSRWGVAANADQIPGYLDTITKGFLQSAQRDPRIKLDSTDYTPGEFIGDPYSGKYVQFTLKSGLKDVLFIFGDNSGLWYGHYIGPADGWLNAMEVLKAIKKS